MSPIIFVAAAVFAVAVNECGAGQFRLPWDGGGIFACRHCYQLAYASAREDISDRAARRADKLRARLGWEPGILNDEGGKPKWMRWRTFERLAAKHDQLVGRSMLAMMLKLGGFRDFPE